MNFSPADGYWYWAAMIFVFGFAAMAISLMQAERRKHTYSEIWLEQSLHWVGVILCLCGTLLLLYRGVLDDQSTGLVMLLVLSLATYLDGIRIGWRFSLVGNFLGLTAVVIAYTENFMWLLFGLAAISIGIVIYWERRQEAWRA